MQETGYEMRISDWSSDGCSSDLAAVALGVSDAVATPVPPPVPSPESATDEASDGLAPGDMEHDVADSGIADGPFDAPRPLVDLGFEDVQAAMAACRERGSVRLRYEGKISGDFTALVQRVAAMADRMDIPTRILDIDSTGGRVEDAMPDRKSTRLHSRHYCESRHPA